MSLIDQGTRTGIYFGTTSGVITTIGLMVGLYAGTGSLVAVAGGVVVIAIADALSDSLGIHLAQESDENASQAQVWAATLSTFAAKFIVTLSFAVPLFFLPLETAVVASIAWGLVVIVVLSYFLSRAQTASFASVAAEHLAIAMFVIGASHYVGVWVNATFG